MTAPHDRKEIAPTLQQLSHAQVKHSQLFGVTNMSGKALTLVSIFGLAIPGTAGLVQGIGFMGPIAGIMLPWTTGAALLLGGVAGGLGAHWLGNFDDKTIANHNSQSKSRLRNAESQHYDRIEDSLVKALQGVKAYNPYRERLPADALGHAVTLPDHKIDELPDYVRLDVYRTQADMALYVRKNLIMSDTKEGLEQKALIREHGTSLDIQADAYRALRNTIVARIADGTLPVTKQTRTSAGQTQLIADDNGTSWGDIGKFIVRQIEDYGRAYNRVPPHIRERNIEFISGLFSGSSSTQTALPVPALPATLNVETLSGAFASNSAPSASTSSSSSSSNSNNDNPKLENLGQAIVIVAALAAVAATIWVLSRATIKNFIHKAPEAELNGVRIPLLTNALKSEENTVRRMYAPKPTV